MVAKIKWLPRATLAILFTVVSGCNSPSQYTQPTTSVGKEMQNEVIDSDRAQPITSQLPLAIDRRPVKVIKLWANNKLGLHPPWASADGVNWLKDELSAGYATGYRRFMLNLPAGHPPGQRLMPSSQWLTMSEERREQLLDMLPQWKADHPDTEISVYMGFPLSDPTSLWMPSSREAQTPSILDDWRWFQDNLQGWTKCGVTEFGFDYAANPRHVASFVKVARVLAIAGIKCIGEAIPRVEVHNGFAVAKEVTLAPFFGLDHFIYERGFNDPWHVDPRTTECGVGISKWMRFGSRASPILVTVEMIRDWVRRGWIPYVYNEIWDELVMKLERERLATETETDPTGDAG